MSRKLCAAEFYSGAKTWLVDHGFGAEIEWQSTQTPTAISESEFLREAAWVVYCSGFRESVVRRYFDYLSLCFFDWQSACDIARSAEDCISSAMLGLRNRRKHEAVAEIARRVDASGFDMFRAEFLADPLQAFDRLPYLGPVTSVHLAKNLGFSVAKPDRHLVRLHSHLGYRDVDAMCRSISASCGDPVGVVDLVLWRYMEQTGKPIAPGARSRSN